MKLVKPSAKVEAMTEWAERVIERAGRTAYQSADKVTEGSAVAFVKSLISRGHESVLEHASATFRLVCDRGVSHELVRHRLASYTQESTRYCNYGDKDIEFVLPPWVNLPEGIWEEGRHEWSDARDGRWATACGEAERRYKDLLALGWTPQQARTVLPNSLKTEVVMTANFREWRTILKLRLDKAAHPQMRELMRQVFYILIWECPVCFEDIAELAEGS